MLFKLLEEMFSEMVIKKDATLIPKYYHEDFLLYTNGIEMGYEKFLEDHISFYQTEIQYSIKYQEETFVEQDDRIAGRIWITTTKPNAPPKHIEVILVVAYKNNKIFRVWELTYPDWSKLPEFKEGSPI